MDDIEFERRRSLSAAGSRLLLREPAHTFYNIFGDVGMYGSMNAFTHQSNVLWGLLAQSGAREGTRCLPQAPERERGAWLLPLLTKRDALRSGRRACPGQRPLLRRVRRVRAGAGVAARLSRRAHGAGAAPRRAGAHAQNARRRLARRRLALAVAEEPRDPSHDPAPEVVLLLLCVLHHRHLARRRALRRMGWAGASSTRAAGRHLRCVGRDPLSIIPDGGGS